MNRIDIDMTAGTIRTLTLLGATLCVLLTSLTASAELGDDDKKDYTASACSPAYPSHAERLVYGTDGGVRNISTISATVVCPILADEYSALRMDVEGWKVWRVTWEDRNPNQSASCSFAELNWNGRINKMWTIRSSPGSDNRTSQDQLIEGECWDGACATGSRPIPFRYGMRCTIPGKSANGVSALKGYMIIED